MTLMVLFCGAGLAQAAELDLGAVTLGQEYTVPKGTKAFGTFTAPATGTVKQVGCTNLDFYSDEAHTTFVDKTYVGYENSKQAYTMKVTEGTTYYLYTQYAPWSDDAFVLYMDGVSGGEQALEVNDLTPEANSNFNFANYPSLRIEFNQAVAASNVAVISYLDRNASASASKNVTATVSGKVVTVPVYSNVQALLEQGNVKPGDEFTVTLSEVRLAGKDAAQGKDFTFTFKFGSIPVRKLSEKVPATFLSYWAPGNADGILSLTFDGELSLTEQTRLELGWGDLESEENKYYFEVLTPTLSDDKKTISVDFTGKLRTPKTMLPTHPDESYSQVSLKLVGVVDRFGNPVASEGQGTVGSYSYAPEYKELSRVAISSEFTPANGTSLSGVDNVTLWLSPVDQFTFSGFNFAYTDAQGNAQNVVVSKSDCTVAQNAAAKDQTWTIPVPAAVKEMKGVTITLADFVCNDGYDHASDVMAQYDTFVITSCDPQNGADLAGLNEDQVITITTNYDSVYPEMYIVYDITDMNAENADQTIIKSESWFTRQTDGSYQATIYGNYKFLTGHTYRMNITAYETEADSHSLGGKGAFATAYVEWHGTSAPYVYSDIELKSIDPAEGTTLAKDWNRTVVVEFTGMVNMEAASSFINRGMGATVAFESITPTDPDTSTGKSYSNIWTLVVPESYMSSLKAPLDLSLAAVDMKGRRVKGNTGEDANTCFYYVYPYAGAFAEDFEISVVGTAPVKTVSEFLVSASRGVSANWNVADDQAVVMNKLREVVATVAERVLPEGEYGQRATTMTLKLNKEITEGGDYVLILPQSYLIIDEEFDAQNSAERTFEFSIEGGEPTPSTFKFTVDPAEGEVEQVSTLTLTFPDFSSASLGSGKATMTLPSGDVVNLPDAEWGAADNQMVQKLNTQGGSATDPGDYVIAFPEGYFNLGDNGDPSPAFSLHYTVKAAPAKLNYTTDPVEGQVKEIESIVLTFTDYMSADGGSGHATLTIEGGEPIQLPDAQWGEGLNQMIQSLGQKYTTEGDYVISFPEGYFNLGDTPDASPAFKLHYIIQTGSISSIVADENGEYRVYNLSGVQVITTTDKAALRALTPAIYIINGVKVALR